ncbi:MAG: VOC family protein [Parvularcula sp.]|jgi:predicted lactoylglutathione lyase|nr:VOC family protein [Parvularcula sp.]
MITHVTIGTNDFEKATSFYGKLFAELGANPLMQNDRMVAWGKSFEEPMVAVCKPYNGEAASSGNGQMVSINCGSKEKVNALHKLALESGAKDEGEPGARGQAFYMAYFRDADGNKMALFAPNRD